MINHRHIFLIRNQISYNRDIITRFSYPEEHFYDRYDYIYVCLRHRYDNLLRTTYRLRVYLA